MTRIDSPLVRIVITAVIVAASATTPRAPAQACSLLSERAGLGAGTPGGAGVPLLAAVGEPMVGQPGMGLRLTDGAPLAAAQILVGPPATPKPLPAYGARLYPGTPWVRFLLRLGRDGSSPTVLSGPAATSPALCGVELVAQGLVADAGATGGLAFTAGLSLRFGVGSAGASLFEGPLYSVVPDATKSAKNLFAVADLDGNGRLDLIVPAGSSQADLRVLRQLGNGTLAPPQSQDLGAFNSLLDLATGDLDDDGLLDVAGAHAPSLAAPSAVVLLRGNGDGTLQPPESVGSPPGAAFAGVAVGDVTGDGLDDLVASGWVVDNVAVLPGPLGPLPATPSALIPLPSLPLARAVRLADADDDGLLDVFVLADAADPKVIVARALGGGAFAAPVAWPAGLVNGEAFDVADVDQDGAADAVVLTPTGILPGELGAVLLLNDGVGGLARVLPLDQGHAWRSVALRDLDGDALPEIVLLPSIQGPVVLDPMWFPNLGGGAFGPPQSLGVGTGTDATLADMDQDGRIDLINLAVPALLSSVWWVRGAGDGTLELPPVLPGMPFGPTRAADLDGDGDLDLVGWSGLSGPASPTIAVALNDGQGHFDPAVTLTLGSSVRDVIVADLDHDGAPDIAASSIAGITTLPGLGDGSFGPPASWALAGARELRAADLDGDLLPELLVACSPPTAGLALLPNLGGLAFGAAIVTPTSASPQTLDAGDVNGDGHPDVVLQIGSGFSILPGTGGLAFGAPIAVADSGGSGSSFPILLADLDGDGDLDLARRNFSGQTQIWINAGGGAFTKTQTALHEGGAPLSAADVNCDGAVDLVGDGVWLGLGGGPFAPLQPGSIVSVYGDLDGDGDPDGAAYGRLFLNRLY